MNPERPLLVQADRMIYVQTNHREYKIIHPVIQEIADLIKTPSAIHVYRMSEYSIWYACEQGITYEELASFLTDFSKVNPPHALLDWIKEQCERFNLLEIIKGKKGKLYIVSKKKGLLISLFCEKEEVLITKDGYEAMAIRPADRSRIKQTLMDAGYPVRDSGGYEEGTEASISLKPEVMLRPYQREACESLIKRRHLDGGNGVIVLPCGAGKTIVGLAIMAEIKQEVLVLTPNDTSLRQWEREIKNKTTVKEGSVGIYRPGQQTMFPITITTYQMLTHRKSKNGSFSHLPLFQNRRWGLIIYDEVHLLPAPLFRFAALLHSTRRVGLTATCVREDKKEKDIFSLIGPKRYEAGIQMLEQNHWIAKPVCKEIRVQFSEEDAVAHWYKSKREQFRHASENLKKLDVLETLLERHQGEKIIVIGSYLNQLKQVRERTGFPLITGETPKEERERLFQAFRDSKVTTLILSKVANLALDLPDAQVGIQLSGAYGSRQEEAQRIGRLLRLSDKGRSVTFYSLVTAGTKEEERAGNRQLFMIEQGYEYESEEWTS
ncbi:MULTISPECIES: DNA repair helicase XPB [Alteribacter]|uniref:DNA 3'-5' helicase n=1 Tax=Alteribacter keqinensis TaxID=2483800 RepID=A0A3M7TY43_9BACI|nr:MULTISPECIES: DNA repair helicase XPB [Alteribacter]MBM7095893.1 helicase-associated domain-containing protein [Alteribacter salitolerans]RNA69714.1 helicase [Alteribacter keqinensis]